MAEAVHMGAGGFAVPPIPDGAQVHERSGNSPPPAAAQVPGFVAPPAPAPAAPAGTFTAEQVQAMIADALKQAQPQAAAPAPSAAPAALAPAAAINTPAELTAATDPVLSSMTAIFTSTVTGLDISRALGNALTHGDPNLIDVAYIREKGGAQADHLLTLAKGIIGRVEAQAQEGVRAVHAAAGGEAQWNASVGVFNTSAPAHQKLVVRQMLDSGNPEMVQAAAQTVVEFAKNSGMVPVAPGLVQAGAAALGSAQGLSKADFQRELLALKGRANQPGYEQARAELYQRRSLGKQLGM